MVCYCEDGGRKAYRLVIPLLCGSVSILTGRREKYNRGSESLVSIVAIVSFAGWLAGWQAGSSAVEELAPLALLG